MRGLRVCLFGIVVAFAIVLAFLFSAFYSSADLKKINDQYYIAHAGGMVDGYKCTNSLEGVTRSINKGIKFIELDLAMTKDSQLVFTHDWELFNKQTVGQTSAIGVTYSDFCKRKIYGKYTPMTYHLLDSVLRNNPDVFFVTDKISTPAIIDKYFHDMKHRLVIECFSLEDYIELREKEYFLPMMHGLSNIKTHVWFLREMIKNGWWGSNIDFYATLYESKISAPHTILEYVLPKPCAVFSVNGFSKKRADLIFIENPEIKLIYVDE